MQKECVVKLSSRSENHKSTDEARNPADAMEQWVKQVVIGLDLCPWARSSIDSGSLLINTSKSSTISDLFEEMKKEIILTCEISQKQNITKLIVFPELLSIFKEYLDFVRGLQDWIEEEGFDGTVQIATFHPKFVYSGTSSADAENYTNRSPYPAIHLLIEQEVFQAVKNYPDTDKIYIQNIRKMNEIGVSELEKMVKKCMHK